MLCLSCVCPAQPLNLNAGAHGTAMYSPCGAVPLLWAASVTWHSPWLLRNHQLGAPCLARGLFFPGGIHGGDGDFLSAGVESIPWRSEKIGRTGWTSFEIS